MVKLSEIEKKNGVVYTPNNLANYVAERVMKYFFESSTLRGELNFQRGVPLSSSLANIRIIDPACGNGELLLAAWDAFCQRLSEACKEPADLFIPDPKSVLCGIDIDQEAIDRTKKRIASISHMTSEKSRFNLLGTNALYPFNKAPSSQGWKIIKNRFQAAAGFDILIANPPWGAETESYRLHLSKGDFSLYRGQFDTSDLFVELALAIVRPDGYFAFILPDSLFNRERTMLRKALLEKTEVKYIGRFGEKIFPNINRACAVLICRKRKCNDLTSVDCLRLNPQLRKGILQGRITFQDAEKLLAHKVRQIRFKANRDYLFDIYLREDEEETLELFNRPQTRFRDYLTSARGVELSKSGKICKCNHCGLWLPYPSARNPQCTHCKSTLLLSNMEQLSIISTEQKERYEPILVGENVNRYLIAPQYWIATDKIGINYKDRSIYEGPKIVVRKTGVGLLAAIDYRDLMTNQVVYIFKCKHVNHGGLPLELLLAILNSRAIYYYLVKTHGETEWRSHPYLTQNQILDLPLPRGDLTTSRASETTQHIVKLLKPYLVEGKGLPAKVDAEVEFLVSSLYGLSRRHYERIYATLEAVEQLLPIRSLNTLSVSDIFK